MVSYDTKFLNKRCGMNIKTELLKAYISDFINRKIEDFDIDADKIVSTSAVDILEQIRQKVADENLSDFDVAMICIAIFYILW